MQAAISLTEVKYAYSPSEPLTLDIAHWQLAQGERCFIHGPSGSGKSTLLNVLTGILRPQRGEVQLWGQSLYALSASQRDKFRAGHIGVIFQQFNLIPYLSVSDNLKAAAYFASSSRDDFEARRDTLLTQLGLTPEIGYKKAGALSVGQQQRVAIARALINQPKLIIADEPTSALDQNARDNFMQLLLTVCGNATVIFVSHDKQLSRYFSVETDIKKINKVTPQCC